MQRHGLGVRGRHDQAGCDATLRDRPRRTGRPSRSVCANALAQTAEVLAASCLALQQAAEQEQSGLKESGLGEAWEAVFENMAATIFMQVAGPNTKKYAQELAGQREYVRRELGGSQDNGSESRSWSARADRSCAIPDGALDVLAQGDAIVIGTTEGTHVKRSIRYVHVPPWNKTPSL